MASFSDLEVWHAAQEIISCHPKEPECAACRRADVFWQEGDMPNFQLWMRIVEAVEELVRTRPQSGTAIN